MRYSVAVRWPGYLTILAAAAVIAVQAFVPPTIGLADNGDFSKVIGHFSLGAQAGTQFNYADTTYRIDPKHHWDAPFESSEKLLASFAINTFLRDGTFDLRWMGLIHGLLLLASVVLLQPCLDAWPLWRRLVISAAMIFMFGDVMYVSLMNSFYMDAVALVSLLLAVVAFIRAVMWGRKFDAGLFVIASGVFVTSKAQHALLGLVLAGLCFALSTSRLFATISAVVLLIATAIGWKSVPPDYASYGIYSAVFIQIVPNSRDASDTLNALGLDDSYKKWTGTHAYEPRGGMDDPGFIGEFMKRTSYARLACFFLSHPRDAYMAAVASLSEAGRQRPPMGNFPMDTGLPVRSESSRFALWSSAKRSLFYGRGMRYLGAILVLQAVFAGAVFYRRRLLEREHVWGALALIAMTLISIGIAALADAVETTRHFLIPTALLDLELICALVTFLLAGTSKKQPDARTLQPAG